MAGNLQSLTAWELSVVKNETKSYASISTQSDFIEDSFYELNAKSTDNENLSS